MTNRTRGLTLIEVLIAMSILSVIAAAIMAALPSLVTMNRASLDDVNVTVVAKTYLERVRDEWTTQAAFDAGMLPAVPTPPGRTCTASVTDPDAGAFTPAIRKRVTFTCSATNANPLVFRVELGRPGA